MSTNCTFVICTVSMICKLTGGLFTDRAGRKNFTSSFGPLMSVLGVAYKLTALIEFNCTIVILDRTCNCNCITYNDLISVISNELIAVNSFGLVSANYLNSNSDTV